MSNTSVQKASWTKPVVQRIGTIQDVKNANANCSESVGNCSVKS